MVLSYPESVYVDQVAPQAGLSCDIDKELISVVSKKTSDETLTAIVCNGTNVNTRHKHGIIRWLEEQLSNL